MPGIKLFSDNKTSIVVHICLRSNKGNQGLVFGGSRDGHSSEISAVDPI